MTSPPKDSSSHSRIPGPVLCSCVHPSVANCSHHLISDLNHPFQTSFSNGSASFFMVLIWEKALSLLLLGLTF
jgi:hypothetical protein